MRFEFRQLGIRFYVYNYYIVCFLIDWNFVLEFVFFLLFGVVFLQFRFRMGFRFFFFKGELLGGDLGFIRVFFQQVFFFMKVIVGNFMLFLGYILILFGGVYFFVGQVRVFFIFLFYLEVNLEFCYKEFQSELIIIFLFMGKLNFIFSFIFFSFRVVEGRGFWFCFLGLDIFFVVFFGVFMEQYMVFLIFCQCQFRFLGIKLEVSVLGFLVGVFFIWGVQTGGGRQVLVLFLQQGFLS